jgi:hypothetical protein
MREVRSGSFGIMREVRSGIFGIMREVRSGIFGILREVRSGSTWFGGFVVRGVDAATLGVRYEQKLQKNLKIWSNFDENLVKFRYVKI